MSDSEREQLKIIAGFMMSMATALISLGILVPILVAQTVASPIDLLGSVQYPLCALGGLLLIVAALDLTSRAHS